MKRDPAKDQKLVLTLTNISTTLKKGEPFFVNIKIQNISDEKFYLDSATLLYLQRYEQSKEERETMNENNFYAGIRYPESFKQAGKRFLEKDESFEFQIDMNALVWEYGNSSDSPENKLMEILVKGSDDSKLLYSFTDRNSEKTLYQNFESNTVIVSST